MLSNCFQKYIYLQEINSGFRSKNVAIMLTTLVIFLFTLVFMTGFAKYLMSKGIIPENAVNIFLIIISLYFNYLCFNNVIRIYNRLIKPFVSKNYKTRNLTLSMTIGSYIWLIFILILSYFMGLRIYTVINLIDSSLGNYLLLGGICSIIGALLYIYYISGKEDHLINQSINMSQGNKNLNNFVQCLSLLLITSICVQWIEAFVELKSWNLGHSILTVKDFFNNINFNNIFNINYTNIFNYDFIYGCDIESNSNDNNNLESNAKGHYDITSNLADKMNQDGPNDNLEKDTTKLDKGKGKAIEEPGTEGKAQQDSTQMTKPGESRREVAEEYARIREAEYLGIPVSELNSHLTLGSGSGSGSGSGTSESSTSSGDFEMTTDSDSDSDSNSEFNGSSDGNGIGSENGTIKALSKNGESTEPYDQSNYPVHSNDPALDAAMSVKDNNSLAKMVDNPTPKTIEIAKKDVDKINTYLETAALNIENAEKDLAEDRDANDKKVDPKITAQIKVKTDEINFFKEDFKTLIREQGEAKKIIAATEAAIATDHSSPLEEQMEVDNAAQNTEQVNSTPVTPSDEEMDVD